MKEGLLNALKFIGFILLIPVVIGALIGFGDQVSELSFDQTKTFLWGIIAYLIIHLFFCELQNIYQNTKNMMLGLFGSVGPVATFMASLAIYPLLLLGVCFLVHLGYKEEWLKMTFLFLASFTFTVHVIFVAKDKRDVNSSSIKPHYLFAVSLIFLLNLTLLVLLLNLNFEVFSAKEFFKTSFAISKDVYWTIFKQLFL